jgi:hypothetical protein
VSYTIAWIVAGVAGVAGTLVLYVLTRGLRNGVLRNLLCLLPLILLLVPAPVPAFPDNFAPAFVVALFESIFVADGRPRAALVILAIALIGASLAIALLSRALTGIQGKRENTVENNDNPLKNMS